VDAFADVMNPGWVRDENNRKMSKFGGQRHRPAGPLIGALTAPYLRFALVARAWPAPAGHPPSTTTASTGRSRTVEGRAQPSPTSSGNATRFRA